MIVDMHLTNHMFNINTSGTRTIRNERVRRVEIGQVWAVHSLSNPFNKNKIGSSSSCQFCVKSFDLILVMSVKVFSPLTLAQCAH